MGIGTNRSNDMYKGGFMKVIDLLNKIAKGEVELGTKFIWHYRGGDVILTFMTRCGALGLFFEEGINSDGEIRWVGLFERYNYQILNDEVEMIEEEKEIEKINYYSIGINQIAVDYIENNEKKHFWLNKKEKYFADKINELIDEINKLKGGKNEKD